MKTETTIRCRNIVVIICLALILAAGSISANDGPTPGTNPADPSVSARSGGSSLLTLTAEQALKLSPLHQELRTILIAEKDQLDVLYEEFALETDSQRALAIQRRIHLVKTETEISLLKAQAETARTQGRTEDVERLERSIRLLSDPEWGPATPVSRPESDAAVRQ